MIKRLGLETEIIKVTINLLVCFIPIYRRPFIYRHFSFRIFTITIKQKNCIYADLSYLKIRLHFIGEVLCLCLIALYFVNFQVIMK